MSNTTDRMLDRYVHLDVKCNPHFTDPSVLQNAPHLNVTAKLCDEGIELSVWAGDECISATWSTYHEMGIEVKALKEFDGDFR